MLYLIFSNIHINMLYVLNWHAHCLIKHIDTIVAEDVTETEWEVIS